MNLQKLNDILDVLGYSAGVINNLSVTDSQDGVDVTFYVPRPKVKEPAVEIKPEPEPEFKTFGEFCEEYEKSNKEPSEEGTDVKEVKKSYKTPIPKAFTRYVFFKSRKSAESFANEYENDFVNIDRNTEDGSHITPHKYSIKKNVYDNDLYMQGYGYLLTFRMDGLNFKVLEQCENLKKKKDSKRHGSACIRYKEES